MVQTVFMWDCPFSREDDLFLREEIGCVVPPRMSVRFLVQETPSSRAKNEILRLRELCFSCGDFISHARRRFFARKRETSRESQRSLHEILRSLHENPWQQCLKFLILRVRFVFLWALFRHFILVLAVFLSFLFVCVQEVFDDISFRLHYPPYGKLLWSLDDADRAHIARLGLSSLCWILAVMVNHGLLTTLVEHFHSEMNGFHLPVGEMMITPEDIWRILRIPFHGAKVVYDRVPRAGTKALSIVFEKELQRGQAISCDELMHTYRSTHRLASMLAIFLSYFLCPNRGQHGLECGWGVMLCQMVEAPEIFGWGQCILAHLYHEMHEIVFHEKKTMASGVYVLQI